MLQNIELTQIKETVKLLNQTGKQASCASVASALTRTSNPKFRPGNWDGHPKFLLMIEEYPNDFQIIVHDPTVKEIVVISDGNVNSTPSIQPSRSLSFEDCLNECLNDELIAETIRSFNLTQDMRDPEIIKMYLKYSYHKAISEGKVLAHGSARMFHTGWFFNGTDPIYCIWGTVSKAYALKFFRRSGPDGRSYRRMFNNQEPEPLIFPRMEFNPDLNIELEFDHIAVDRFNRIPNVVKKMMCAALEIPYHDNMDEDAAISAENNSFLYRLLLGCLEETRLRIRNNTEEAVPFWNKRYAQMSWLFPLRMDVTNEVNLVAILEPTTLNGREIYRAHTVLGLKEAYINARILGPVTAEWLKDAWH